MTNTSNSLFVLSELRWSRQKQVSAVIAFPQLGNLTCKNMISQLWKLPNVTPIKGDWEKGKSILHWDTLVIHLCHVLNGLTQIKGVYCTKWISVSRPAVCLAQAQDKMIFIAPHNLPFVHGKEALISHPVLNPPPLRLHLLLQCLFFKQLAIKSLAPLQSFFLFSFL